MAKRLDQSLDGSKTWKKKLRELQLETHLCVNAIRRQRTDLIESLLNEMESLAQKRAKKNATCRKPQSNVLSHNANKGTINLKKSRKL